MHPPIVSELFTEKRLHVRNWMWKQRFERLYGPRTGLTGQGRDLRFLFGVEGSGVDHLARLIIQPGVPLRYFHNVLARFEPRLSLSTQGGDRLAMPYGKDLEPGHPLLRVYRMLVESDNEWAALRSSNRVRPEDPGSFLCLVKESHALLSIEAVLRHLEARALLYVGDPIKIVDRLFNEQGETTPYLLEEGRSVLAPYFLARFLRRDYQQVMQAYRRIRRVQDERQRNVLHRVLIVAVIQHMFRMLCARYPQQAILVEYDRLAQDPLHLESLLEGLFGERGLTLGRQVTAASTFKPQIRDQVIWRSTWPERALVPRVLRAGDIQASEEMLRDSGLEMPLPSVTRESFNAARGA